MQLDLFAAGGIAPAQAPKTEATLNLVDLATLSDAAILAAIPDAGIPLVFSLMYEADRRRLQEAIPVLGRLCRLFAGFGTEREVPEQTVALLALGSIGGRGPISRIWIVGRPRGARADAEGCGPRRGGPSVSIVCGDCSAALAARQPRGARYCVRSCAPSSRHQRDSDRATDRSRCKCANLIRLRAWAFWKTRSESCPQGYAPAGADARHHRSNRSDRRSRMYRAIGKTRQSPDRSEECGARCACSDR